MRPVERIDRAHEECAAMAANRRQAAPVVGGSRERHAAPRYARCALGRRAAGAGVLRGRRVSGADADASADADADADAGRCGLLAEAWCSRGRASGDRCARCSDIAAAGRVRRWSVGRESEFVAKTRRPRAARHGARCCIVAHARRCRRQGTRRARAAGSPGEIRDERNGVMAPHLERAARTRECAGDGDRRDEAAGAATAWLCRGSSHDQRLVALQFAGC